jgi:hypothetical protein
MTALDDRQAPHVDRLDPPRVARRQRSWFFARGPRGGRSLELSADLERRPEQDRQADAPGTAIVDLASTRRAAFPLSAPDRHAAAADRTWPAPEPPISRRPIFGVFAKRRPIADRSQAAATIVAQATPPIDPPSPALHRPTPSFTPSSAGSSVRAPTPAFGHASDFDLDAPPRATENQRPRRAVAPAARRSSGWETPAGRPDLPDRRLIFAEPRPVSSRPASRLSTPASDDRWPALPPGVFAPPLAVEALAPRWEQLAREQEEGRWSV